MSAAAAVAKKCATCKGKQVVPVKYAHTAQDGHVWMEPRTETCGTCRGTGEQP